MPPSLAPSSEIYPRLAEGRALADAGDLAGAEEAFRVLLTGALPGTYDRQFVLGSMMTVFSRGWRVWETLIIARHLTDQLREAGQLAAAAGCLATYCESLLEVAPDELLQARTDELGVMLEAVPADEGQMPREAYHNCAFKLATRRGDLAIAKAHAERYRTFTPSSDGRSWRKSFYVTLNDVELDLMAGMPHRALETLERSASIVEQHEEPQLQLARNRLRCLTRLELLEEANAEARRYLGLLESRRDDMTRIPNRIRYASVLADWCRDRTEVQEIATAAYEIAAAGMLARIPQLERAVVDLGGLGIEAGAAAEDLATIRKSFLAEQGALLAQAASFLARDPSALRALLVEEGEGGALIHLCAWCERVLTPAGQWIPVGHFIPREGPVPISHAICQDCLVSVSDGQA